MKFEICGEQTKSVPRGLSNTAFHLTIAFVVAAFRTKTYGFGARGEDEGVEVGCSADIWLGSTRLYPTAAFLQIPLLRSASSSLPMLPLSSNSWLFWQEDCQRLSHGPIALDTPLL